MVRARTQRRSSEKLHPRRVSEALFRDQPVEHQGWLIRINADTDMVEVFPPDESPYSAFEAPLTHLDAAVNDFCREAAMPIPGVNETQGPQVKLPGSASEILGEDSSVGEGPSQGKPKINKRPKGTDPKGTMAPNTSLGPDSTDRAPKNFDVRVVDNPMPPEGRGGLPDTSLGSDTSGASTDWRDKIVKIREDGKNARRALHEVKKPRRGPGQLGVGKAQMGEEAAPMVDGSDDEGGAPAAAPTGGPHGGPPGAVARRRRAEDSDPFKRPVVEEPGKKLNTGETPTPPEKVVHTTQGEGKDEKDETEGKKGRFVDTFDDPTPDASHIYRQMSAERPSEKLLRDIMDPEKWAANHVFLPKSSSFQVIVQGMGEVYNGDSYREAEEAFQEFSLQSAEEYGRAAGKAVAIFEDGEVLDEYLGSVEGDSRDSLHGDPEDIGFSEHQGQSATDRAIQDVQDTKPVSPTEQALTDVYSAYSDWECPSCGDYGNTDEAMTGPDGRTLCPTCMQEVEVSEGKAAARRYMTLKVAQWALGDGTAETAEVALIEAGYDPMQAGQIAAAYEAGQQIDAEATAIIEAALQQGAMTAAVRRNAKVPARWMAPVKMLRGPEPKVAGPRLKENWGNDGGYGRDLEAESAEELHALTLALGGDDSVDWSKFRPLLPGAGEGPEAEGEEAEQAVQAAAPAQNQVPMPESEQATAPPVGTSVPQTQARRESGRPFSNKWAQNYGDLSDADAARVRAQGGELAENWMSGDRKDVIAAVSNDPVLALSILNALPNEEHSSFISAYEVVAPNRNVAIVKRALAEGDLAAECGGPHKREEKEAVDDAAKDYWQEYYSDSDYGKALTREDAPKQTKDKGKKKDKDKGESKEGRRAAWLRATHQAQVAPMAAPAPAPAPAAPAAPMAPPKAPAPGGAPIPGGAPAPKGPAGGGMSPGTGDQGLQVLGWTPEDIALMDEEDKKKVLQIQLSKPGTKKAPTAPGQEKPAAPPAVPAAPGAVPPGAPAGAPAGMPAVTAPPPVSPPVAARMAKTLMRKLNQRRVLMGQAVAPQPMPATPAPAPAAPGAPAVPGAPKPAAPVPGAPAAPGATPPPPEAMEDITDEQRAFQILSEIQQAKVEATTPEQVSSIKASQLAQRLLTELGMTMTEARDLFGLAKNKSFSSLLQ